MIIEKKVNEAGNILKVLVKFEKRTPREEKKTLLTSDLMILLKKEYEILNCLKTSSACNYNSNSLQGEWLFLLKQKEEIKKLDQKEMKKENVFEKNEEADIKRIIKRKKPMIIKDFFEEEKGEDVD
jgi:hypothetical protein